METSPVWGDAVSVNSFNSGAIVLPLFVAFARPRCLWSLVPSGGEFDDESTAAACFNGVRWCAMHALCAGSASERCMLSESAASACLSQPYDPIVWLREGLFASTMWPTRSICMVLTAAVLTIVIVGTVACSVAKKLTILGYRQFFFAFWAMHLALQRVL